MKPAIDQMIAHLEGEMAHYPESSIRYMDRGYRTLEQVLNAAREIKVCCDADEIEQAVAAEMAFNNAFGAANDADDEAFRAATNAAWLGRARVVCEVDDVGTTDCLIPSICTIKTDRR